MDEVIAHLATATVRTAYVVLCLAFGGFLGLLGCVGVAMPYIDDSHERLVILVAPASRAPLVARVCVAVCIVVAVTVDGQGFAYERTGERVSGLRVAWQLIAKPRTFGGSDGEV
jgi:hypothetical protein